MAVDDSYTKVLLHMGGIDASTTFIDESGKTWTASGHAQIDTAQYKFGGASGLFDGNGDDYISTPISSDFALTNGDFTVDFWMRAPAFNAYSTICMTSTIGNQRSWGVNISGGTALNFYYSVDGINDPAFPSVSYTFSTNTWYHIAVSRTGGKIYFFVNGILINIGGTALTATFFTATSGGMYIGRFADYTPSTHAWNGWVDEFRLSKGIARWISDFTPPTQPYGGSILPQMWFF